MTKYKKSILTFLLTFSLIILNIGSYNLVDADNATSTVQVGNAVPIFTTYPHEDPASTETLPTNEGDNVTFKAIATDANSDQWKLLICKTNGVTGTSCSSGTWCSSGYVNSGSEASCSYQTQNSDSWSNDWYGFACDSQGCSSVSQGSGDSGSPFYTNHRPTFTAISSCNNADPNTSCQITATATDSDTSHGDSISLYVCKTADFSTSTLTCNGGSWCSVTGQSSNPSCTIPNVPRPDGSYSYYPYIIDSYKLTASSTLQGTEQTYNVNNVAPTIDASSIHVLDTDGTGNLTLLNEGTSTPGFKVTFIVNDNNSCKTITNGNEITTAIINLRTSDIAQGSCINSGDYNANYCYPAAYTGWNLVCTASSTVDSCDGNTDTTVGWVCTFPLEYHADPTVAGTPKATYNWVAAVKATDDDGSSSSLTDSTTYSNELDTFLGYDVSPLSINYGTVSPNATSTEQSTAVLATGNVALDENLSGTDMSDGNGHTIAVGQQHYATSTGQLYDSMTALTTSPTRTEINCPKTTVTNNPASSTTIWVIKIPNGQATGTYTGTNSIEGVTDQSYGG